MSKGLGGGGHGGGGGSAGTAGAAVARLKRDGITSVVKLNPTREASKAYQAGKFAGVTSRAGANAVATSHAFYKQGGMPISVMRYPNGKMAISDGNHRISQAKAAGATRIRVDVNQMGPRGGVRSVAKGIVVKI